METNDCGGSLSGQNIVCLATHAWDAHWTPVQQVMARLAPQNKVIYIEPFHPPLAWLKKSNKQLKGELEQKVPYLREAQPNLFVYRPQSYYLPGNMRSKFAAGVNAPRYKAEVKRLLERLGVERPWLWAFFAQSLSVLDLDFEHFIYDCADDIPPYFSDPAEHRFATQIDEGLCRRAELVFVGSEPLLGKKAPFNPRTFVVNHAADIAHFTKAAAEETKVPDDLERIPKPRIGFVGMMDAVRFDVDLINRLAVENPNYQIVIVGGFVGDAQVMLPVRDNIHLLGMKPVAELPGYLKGMDVCLMPYRLNEATRHIYPLKLHEYMATGKPVVATSIPAVQGFRELMYVAANPDHFVELAARALAEDDSSLPLKRIECAQQHTWEIHVRKKAELINRHLFAADQAARATS